MKIPLIDLRAQYQSMKSEIDRAISEVFESSQFILGKKVEEFEQELAAYCDAAYGIGVASGTDALIISLESLGIGVDDEVITSPFTFIATAEAISRVGATPVFADIDPKTFNIDVGKMEQRISTRTKAIIPVHLFGHPADMDPILAVAEKYDLRVIEDACQAIGAEYKQRRTGGLGDTGCFSFFPSKNLGGAGDGGMIVTNNPGIAERAFLLRQHGSSRKYYHSLIGHNSRLDALQAALLSVKLKRLDDWNNKRRQNAFYYNKLLASVDLTTPSEAGYAKHVYHLYIVRTQTRDSLAAKLRENGIGAGVYYPLPLHLQEAYKSLGYKTGDLPVSEQAAAQCLALPQYPEITQEQIAFVAGTISGN